MKRRSERHQIWTRPLLGVVILAAGLAALVISYNADKGLPFRSSFRFAVDVPNAQELNQGDNVQIGGARVGQVLSIVPVPHGAHPYARIQLTLNGNPHLPVNSTVSIEPLSILGEKTLVLHRGTLARKLAVGAVLPLSQARPVVDLNAALSTFNPPTVTGLQGTLNGLANGVAGRGNDINTLIASLAPLLPALQRVSEVLVQPGTDLPGLIDQTDQFFTALDPVAGTLPQLLSSAARTFSALASAEPALANLISELPAAESATTTAFTAATPALGYLRQLVSELRPAGAELPAASSRLVGALQAATPTLRRLIGLAAPLNTAADALAQTLPPHTYGLWNSLNELDVTVRNVQALDEVVGPAQEICNVLGTALRNGGDVIGEGDAQGSWFTFAPILSPFEFPTGTTDNFTHVNDHPTENSHGCVAGNEPYLPGPHFGNPPAKYLTTAHDVTAPPPAATQRARAAGLLTAPTGARLR